MGGAVEKGGRKISVEANWGGGKISVPSLYWLCTIVIAWAPAPGSYKQEIELYHRIKINGLAQAL